MEQQKFKDVRDLSVVTEEGNVITGIKGISYSTAECAHECGCPRTKHCAGEIVCTMSALRDIEEAGGIVWLTKNHKIHIKNISVINVGTGAYGDQADDDLEVQVVYEAKEVVVE